MTIIIFIISALAFAAYLIYRSRQGHAIAIYLHRFESLYNSEFENTQSKEQALRHSLPTFSQCPILNRLSEDDYERIINILRASPYPEKIIQTIVLKMDAKTSLKAFQNSELLSELASVQQEGPEGR